MIQANYPTYLRVERTDKQMCLKPGAIPQQFLGVGNNFVRDIL